MIFIRLAKKKTKRARFHVWSESFLGNSQESSVYFISCCLRPWQLYFLAALSFFQWTHVPR